MSSILPEKLAFVDIETTGGSFLYDRIIEIAILRVEKKKVVARYEQLIDPQTHVPPEITRLTGIMPAQLEGAPTFRSVKDEVTELLDDCVFVAHNARFDYSFIKHELKREHVHFKPKQLCTCSLSRMLFPRFKRHNLDMIIERFDITCKARHRAMGDAAVLWDFYKKVTKIVKKEKLEKALTHLFKRPSLPSHVKLKDIEELPEGPGVYIFYGENGMPIYVGKSVNVRDRVMSHFSSSSAVPGEMKLSLQVRSIETIATPGELGALIAESDLIKKLQPLYNRVLRHAHEMVLVKKTVDADGYFTVHLSTADTIEPNAIDDILGVFRSKKQATQALVGIAKEHSLCQKLLGIEKRKGSCFGFGLGSCKGACKGRERVAFYNARFTLAFAKHKIQRWPFDGAVVIPETDGDKSESHVIDNWCYLGKVRGDGDSEHELTRGEVVFDHDIYKIVARFLRNERNIKRVRAYKASEQSPHISEQLFLSA